MAGTLGALLPPTNDKFVKAAEHNIDLQSILSEKIKPTLAQLKILAQEKISTTYPRFAGFTIHNLYEFFMVFVILSGAAALLLLSLSKLLRRMMHGVK